MRYFPVIRVLIETYWNVKEDGQVSGKAEKVY